MRKMYNVFGVQEFRKTASSKTTQTFVKRIGWPTDDFDASPVHEQNCNECTMVMSTEDDLAPNSNDYFLVTIEKIGPVPEGKHIHEWSAELVAQRRQKDEVAKNEGGRKFR